MKNSIKERFAFFISAIFTPPLVVALAILAIAFYYSDRYELFWLWAAAGILLLIGPASIYVYVAYKKGKVSDINMSEREERLRPLIISLIGAVIVMWVLMDRNAPKPLILLGMTLVSELVVIIFVTTFWKISLHALAYSSAVTLLAYLFNPLAVVLYIFLVPIGWARIYRKRHSLLQVIVGSIVGLIIVLAIFMLFDYPAG